MVVALRLALTYSVVNAIWEKKEDGLGPRCDHTLTAVAVETMPITKEGFSFLESPCSHWIGFVKREKKVLFCFVFWLIFDCVIMVSNSLSKSSS